MKTLVGNPAKPRAIGKFAAAALATMVVLAGCSSEPSSEDGGNNPLKVVAVTTAAEVMLTYVAEEQGLFEAEGVDVEVVPFTSGTKVQIPKVLSGEFDIGYGGMADLLLSVKEGAPFVILQGTGSVGNGDLQTSSQAYYTSDPEIQRPRDLEGHRVGTQVLGGASEGQIKAAIAEDGGDPSKVELVSIPMQNGPNAVAEGQIDVGQGMEPYLTIARSMGLTDVFSSSVATEGLPEAVTFTTVQVVEDRPDDIAAYIRAMQAAAAMVNENPELMREVVREHTEIDPEYIDQIRGFGRYNEGIPASNYQDYVDIMVEQGVLEDVPPVEEWLYAPAS